MESSIRSRNITEPKLHSDWSTEKKHPYPLHGDYNSNEHVSAYIRSNRPKDQVILLLQYTSSLLCIGSTTQHFLYGLLIVYGSSINMF